MRVFIERSGQWRELQAPDVSSLLVLLGLDPGTVLVVRNGSLVTVDELLEAADEVRVLSVVSGG